MHGSGAVPTVRAYVRREHGGFADRRQARRERDGAAGRRGGSRLGGDAWALTVADVAGEHHDQRREHGHDPNASPARAAMPVERRPSGPRRAGVAMLTAGPDINPGRRFDVAA
jgi:hypothetical protein